MFIYKSFRYNLKNFNLEIFMNYLKSISLIATLLFSFTLFAQDIQVVRLGGKVLVNNKPVTKSSILQYGDVIKALGAKTFIQVKFQDQSMVMLKDGEIVIEEPKNLKKPKNIVQLLKGMFFAYKKKNSSTDMEVKTKNISMGVRGTKFYVQESEKDTYLCVCEGVVSAQNKMGQVNVAKNQDLHALSSQKPVTQTASSTMIDMSYQGFAEMGFKIK